MVVVKPVEEEISQFVHEIISDDPSLFVVRVILKGNAGNQRLIVLLDGDHGVTIDQCSSVSRQLAQILEEKELFEDKYFLEVSSAGVDFPLQNVRQYTKNIGRSLKVELNDASTISGLLKEVNNEMIMIEVQEKKELRQHQINFNEISKSMVLVSFK